MEIKTIDEYIAQYNSDIQIVLQELRAKIKEFAPEATEKISWGRPTFMMDGILVQFAVAKHHIGFYPGPEAVEAFKDELVGYKTTKGGIQLPFTKTIPYDVIQKIVAFNKTKNENKKRK